MPFQVKPFFNASAAPAVKAAAAPILPPQPKPSAPPAMDVLGPEGIMTQVLASPPVGINRPGNNCWANTTLQVLITNELFGLFIANGYSWASGKTAVCLSIAGPGFTNMFTGLAQALTDSIPVLVLVVGKKTSGKKFGTKRGGKFKRRRGES